MRINGLKPQCGWVAVLLLCGVIVVHTWYCLVWGLTHEPVPLEQRGLAYQKFLAWPWLAWTVTTVVTVVWVMMFLRPFQKPKLFYAMGGVMVVGGFLIGQHYTPVLFIFCPFGQFLILGGHELSGYKPSRQSAIGSSGKTSGVGR